MAIAISAASVFEVVAVCRMVLVEAMPAASEADSETSPAAVTEPLAAAVKSIEAFARLLTLFIAATAPPAVPFAPHFGEKTRSSCASEMPSLPTNALICAVLVAVSDRSPATSTGVSSR